MGPLRLHRVFALTTLVLLSLFSSIQSASLSVKQYNAVGDGVTYDTAAIQSSIENCANTGGGYVAIPPGTYLTGTLYLKSGVFLVLQEGAKLLAGTRPEDYPADPAKRYLILAENAHDVAIGGDGEIDGQGSKFVKKVDPVKNVMKDNRPKLVGFVNCHNVLVSKIKFNQPAYWAIHVAASKNATIADISINGDFNTPDNNGIVIEDSSDMIITRTNIDTAGDGIVMMTNKAPVDNIIGTQSSIRSKSSGIKLGDASFFDFTRILFVDTKIVDSHRGIALQLRDGGNIDNATFTRINITTQYYDPSWVGNAEPITVTTCQRNSRSRPAGTISTLMFYDLQINSENGVLLSGSENAGHLRDVKFVKHNMQYQRKTHYPAGGLDFGPGWSGFEKANPAAIFMERVDGIMELEDVGINYDPKSFPYWKTPLSYNPTDVTGMRLIRFQSNPPQPQQQ